MRARYLGPPVSHWYGMDLLTGQEITLPGHLAHKARPPLFEAAGKPEPAAEPEPSEAVADEPAPRRRGRPRKTPE